MLRLFCGQRIQVLEILEGYTEKSIIQVRTPQGSVRAVPYFMNGSNDGSEHVGILSADVTKLKRVSATLEAKSQIQSDFLSDTTSRKSSRMRV